MVPLAGVGGWLLFLILCLTVFGPLIALFLAILTLLGGGMFSSKDSDFLICALAQSLVIIPSAVWALNAGIGLWKIRPGAVRRAKLYLMCGGIPGVFLFYQLQFWLLKDSELAETGNPPSRRFTSFLIVMFIAINLAFLAYLGKSRRVAATYPQG